MSMPFIVAHRGYKARYPENTMAAFIAAITSGAHAIECDIQFSRDLVPMIIHDADLSRTTGRQGSVFDCDASDLSRMTADNEHPCEQSGDVTIPRLTALMGLMTQYPALQCFVEIKAESIDYFGVDVVMAKLEGMLQAFDSQCVIISYEKQALQHVQSHSKLKTGWVLHHYDSEHRQEAQAFKPDYLICNVSKLAVDKMPWPGPWQWMLYEINAISLAENWLKLGVDYIETASVSVLSQSSKFSPSRVMDKPT